MTPEQARYQQLMRQLAGMAQRSLDTSEPGGGEEREECDGQQLADTAHALAHAGVLDEGVASQLLAAASRQAQQGRLSVQGLADVLVALGSARYRPTPAVMQRLLADVDPLTRCETSQELSALLQGLSRLGYQPDEAFVSAVLSRMQARQAAQERAAAQAQQAQARQAQAQGPPGGMWGLRGMSLPGWLRGRSPGSAPSDMQETTETTDAEESELEEARHVAAAIQALQRMGHSRQAAQLQATYLRDLQARAAARLQQQEQARSEQDAGQQARKQQVEEAAAAQQREQARLAAEQQRKQREVEEEQERARAAAQAQAQARALAERQAAAEQALQAQQRRAQAAAAERERQEREAREAREAREQAEREATEREAAARAAAQQEQEAQAEEQQRATKRAVQAAIARAPTWQHLRAILYSFSPYLAPRDLTEVVVRLRGQLLDGSASLTWRERAEVSSLLEHWGGLLAEQLDDTPAGRYSQLTQAAQPADGSYTPPGHSAIEPGDVVRCLAALSDLRWHDSRTWGVLLRAARPALATFSPTELAGLLAPLAAAGLRPSQAWTAAYLEACAARLAGFAAPELVDVITCLSRLGVKPGAPWLLAYLGAVQSKEDELSPDQAATCVRAAAALDPPLVQRWYTGLIESRRAAKREAALAAQRQAAQQRASPASAAAAAGQDSAQPASQQGPASQRAQPAPASPPPPAAAAEAVPPAKEQPAATTGSPAGSAPPADVAGQAWSTEPADQPTPSSQPTSKPHSKHHHRHHHHGKHNKGAGQTLTDAAVAREVNRPAPQPPQSSQLPQGQTDVPATSATSGSASGTGGGNAAAAASPTTTPAQPQAGLPTSGADVGSEPAGLPVVEPDAIIPDMESIDFDEEQAARSTATSPPSGAQLPDTFLLDQLQRPTSQPPASQGAGRAGRRPTPAEQRALRSVLLERVELAEDARERAQQAIHAANIRAENAAIQVAFLRGQADVLQGDYDRVVARHEKDKLDVTQQAKQDVFQRLLPLLDNFERAEQSLKPGTPGEKAVQDAYQTVPAQLKELLKSAGIEEVPGEGSPFDPAVHDAIMQEYDASVPDGTVLQVLQRGYRGGDRLLRPALVKVSMS